MKALTKPATKAIHTAALTGILVAVLSAPVTAADFSGSLKSVTITDTQVINKPPSVAFSSVIDNGTVTFDASGCVDPDGTILKYNWDFGDGTTGSGVRVNHQFAASPQSVTLTVMDDKGGVAIAQTKIYTKPFDIITDDADTNKFFTVGTWNDSTSSPNYYNVGYKTAPTGTGSSTATWTIEIPTEGKYNISCYYTAHSNRASNAPFTLSNNGATIGSIKVNQKINGSTFFSLGEYTLTPGQLQITLSNAGDGYSIADAVRISYIP